MPDKKKLILVDGHALAYRAYHALPTSLATSQGEVTNAVYGFTSMLLNTLRDEEPEYIAVTFDVGRPFRHDLYKDYKANRAAMPDDLRWQLERIREIVSAMNIPIFEVEGYEADDVLGTLAKQADASGVETLIVTGDTDTFQLIGPHVRVLTSRRQFSDTVIYDEAKVRERYGLEPEQLIDLKGLVGDVSDNVPGVSGVGQKTAAPLLQQFGSIESIYEHLDEIKSKRARTALEAGRESAFLSKQLVTIVTEVPVALDLEACHTTDFDAQKVRALFRDLEFRSLLDRLPQSQQAGAQLSMFDEDTVGLPQAAKGEVHIVYDQASLSRLAGRLARAAAFALDVETTHLDPLLADLVGIAVAMGPDEAYYIPVGHHESQRQLPIERALAELKPALEGQGVKYMHNGKYDLAVLTQRGATVEGPLFDTMVAAWLLEPARRGFGLKDLAWARFNVDMHPITDLIGKGRDQITMADVPVDSAADYAAADVVMTWRLAEVLAADLKAHGLWDLYQEAEMPLVPILMEMELTGVHLDVEHLQQISRELYQRIADLESDIYELVGYPFNVNSTKQLGQVLFEHLGLPVQKRTKTGPSTDASVLEALRGKHPVIDHLLEYRQLTKLKSTYVDALPLLVNRRTGRVHTSYNQTGTVTGRLSSSNPNLQNIPIRTEEGRRIRRAFAAEEGRVLLAADYSQVELRILAHITGDEGLLAAFRRGEDIHASTAATIFGVPLGQVTPDMRRVAKMINFGLSYGMSSFGLARRTGLSNEEADGFIKSYFASYPGVADYMDRIVRQAKQQGYVETLLGRRRYFPEFKSRRRVSGAQRRAAEREAINMPIQGSSADIIKLAMIRLDRALKGHGLDARMILQVHDELVLELPEGEAATVTELLRQAMEGAFELVIALKVDIKAGKNWEEMEEVKV